MSDKDNSMMERAIKSLGAFGKLPVVWHNQNKKM